MKLKNLAVIYASQKEINGKKCFRYYKIYIYQLRSFDVFLDLLRIGKIDVYLEARVGRSGSSLGRYKNKNLIFKIKKELIEELFVEVYHVDHDNQLVFADNIVIPDINFGNE